MGSCMNSVTTYGHSLNCSVTSFGPKPIASIPLIARYEEKVKLRIQKKFLKFSLNALLS